MGLKDMLFGTMIVCSIVIGFMYVFGGMFASPIYSTTLNTSKFASFNNTLNDMNELGNSTFENIRNIQASTGFIATFQSWLDLFLGGIWTAFKVVVFGIPTTIYTILNTIATELHIPTFILSIALGFIIFIVIFEIFRIFLKTDV